MRGASMGRVAFLAAAMWAKASLAGQSLHYETQWTTPSGATVPVKFEGSIDQMKLRGLVLVGDQELVVTGQLRTDNTVQGEVVSRAGGKVASFTTSSGNGSTRASVQVGGRQVQLVIPVPQAGAQ